MNLGIQSAFQANSHALILVAGAMGEQNPWSDAFSPDNALLCFLTLPLCLLDEKAGTGALRPKDLADNGYSPVTIANITNDQKKIAVALLNQNQKVVLEASDTVDSVYKKLNTIDSSVSEDYAAFLIDYQGL